MMIDPLHHRYRSGLARTPAVRCTASAEFNRGNDSKHCSAGCHTADLQNTDKCNPTTKLLQVAIHK